MTYVVLVPEAPRCYHLLVRRPGHRLFRDSDRHGSWSAYRRIEALHLGRYIAIHAGCIDPDEEELLRATLSAPGGTYVVPFPWFDGLPLDDVHGRARRAISLFRMHRLSPIRESRSEVPVDPC